MAAIRGGEKLEAALREISAKVSKAATLRVGFLEGATYPDGTSVPMVAAIQEYGAPKANIPPRPYFRNMIAEKSPSWGGAVETNLLAQNYDVERTLELVGDGIKGQLQQSILDTNSPPLSKVTIAAKGFDKPLIHHNDMINAAAYEVKT